MVSEILGKFSICPVYTGMNRRTIACPDRWSHLPRVHGDEPMEGTGCTVVRESAPVRTGMNLTPFKRALRENNLPRTHGDEPHSWGPHAFQH
mgnify:CR=1 FL=1